MKIYQKKDLLSFDQFPLLLQKIEQGFADYSLGQVVMPPVGHMHFEKPTGDLHVKCAVVPNQRFYVVKVASVFPENAQQGLPSLTGLMLLFSQKTGELAALFFDEGYLTHLRTGIAGAIAAKYLARNDIEAIGIIGTGKQAVFQLRLLEQVTSCRQVFAWSHHPESIKQYQENELLKAFKIEKASSPQEIAEKCLLIVTTTPSQQPLLFKNDIRKGTHITAVGADRPGKQELDAALVGRADRVVVDSRAQCFNYGETHAAIEAGFLKKERVDELGEIVASLKNKRKDLEEITIADLTGLGIQDLVIAEIFYDYLEQR